MLDHLYFCNFCRTKIEKIELVQFVEEHSDRGFCSEKCIMDFYRPYMNALEEEESLFRHELNLANEEELLEYLASDHHMQAALSYPSEIWVYLDDLDQTFYTHILKIDEGNAYFIIICSYVENGPSFVFYRTATVSLDLLSKYKRGDLRSDIIEGQVRKNDQNLSKDLKIPTEVLEEVELKKSHLLAEMLNIRKEIDISFEKFYLYDSYMGQSFEFPDEIYEYRDDDGDKLHIYLKSIKSDENSFYYIVINFAYEYLSEDGLNKLVLIPIIGFPTIDKDIYTHYCLGNKLNQTLKN